MAITKLLNIKSTPSGSGRHLYNAIKYILNPHKTEQGILVGGNSGSDYQEVYQTMFDTKRMFGKTDKRQGYHFVISFKPGEINKEEAYQVIQEFCDEYLGDAYDTVFAVHDDQKHIHGHIIFNSVSRLDGYKYHYKKGDWERSIQPITDSICKKYGFGTLEFQQERVGRSYAEYNALRKGNVDWGMIIRRDIDYAISKVVSYEKFLNEMQEMGYKVHQGILRNHGEYITFTPPGRDRGRRSNRLGRGYTVEDIKQRILNPSKISIIPKIPKIKALQSSIGNVSTGMKLSRYQQRQVRYLHQIRYYHRYLNPYDLRAAQFRKSYLEIQKIYQDCCFLLKNNIRTKTELNLKKGDLLTKEKLLKALKSTLESNDPLDAIRREYHRLENQLAIIPEGDDSWEEIEDRLIEILDQYPEVLMKRDSSKISEIQQQLNEVYEKKRCIRHIEKMERMEIHIVKNSERRMLYNYGKQERERKR